MTVDSSLAVPQLPAAFGGFAGMPDVFATAYLVALVEDTCIEALAPYVEAHERTVGTHVDVSHRAATPAGMRGTAAGGARYAARDRRSARSSMRRGSSRERWQSAADARTSGPARREHGRLPGR